MSGRIPQRLLISSRRVHHRNIVEKILCKAQNALAHPASSKYASYTLSAFNAAQARLMTKDTTARLAQVSARCKGAPQIKLEGQETAEERTREVARLNPNVNY
eukprot:781700-Pleurochrysis_carterae.AAC.2